MRMMTWMVAILVIALGSCLAVAQGVSGLSAPPQSPVKAKGTLDLESKVIPGDKINGVPLGDMLDYLKEKMPGFNSVIIRSPNVPDGYPEVPAMTLKNVTLGQFLELLKTSVPGVDIHRIDGEVPLYVFHIEAANGIPSPSASKPGGLFQAEPVKLGAVVKVYSLHDLVANGNGAKDPKHAMDDVLSLVQATFDQAGGDPKDQPILKVHEATQVLIFKGSAEKMALLEQVLESLQPKDSSATAAVRKELEACQDALERSNVQRNDTIANLRALSQDRQALQADVIRYRAEAENATLRLTEVRRSATQPSK